MKLETCINPKLFLHFGDLEPYYFNRLYSYEKSVYVVKFMSNNMRELDNKSCGYCMEWQKIIALSQDI